MPTDACREAGTTTAATNTQHSHGHLLRCDRGSFPAGRDGAFAAFNNGANKRPLAALEQRLVSAARNRYTNSIHLKPNPYLTWGRRANCRPTHSLMLAALRQQKRLPNLDSRTKPATAQRLNATYRLYLVACSSSGRESVVGIYKSLRCICSGID